jgi:hypothetical protein
LATLSVALPNRNQPSPQTEIRRAEIAKAFADVPLFIDGNWVGRDEVVAQEAQKLLRPNAILSRRYDFLGEPRGSVQLLVVHCGDARDMIGHYPPICYPSAGFIEDLVSENRDTTIQVAGRTLPVRQYVFHRARDRVTLEQLRIFSAFVLPDGTVTREIDDINKQSERLAVTVQGVAQMQVVTPAAMPLDQALNAAQELLGGMTGLLQALNVGQGAPGET